MKNQNSPWRPILIFFAIFIASLFYLKKVYFNLSIAFILAYLLEPIVGWLEKKNIKRQWGALLTLVTFGLVFILLFILVSPKIFRQAHELIVRLPQVYRNVMELLSGFSDRTFGYNIFSDINQTINQFGSSGAEIMKPISGIVSSVFSTTFQFVVAILGFLIIPLLSFYLLREFPYLYRKTVLRALPDGYHKVADEIRKRFNQVLGGFIRGQLVVSTILSIYYATALTLAGLELSLLIGVLAGFLNIIPYIGIISILVLSILIALIHAATSTELIVIVVIYLVGMVLEGSFITPKILGKKVGLSPLTLIVALLVGGELFGIIGMVIAVPIAAIIKVLIEMTLEHRLKIG